MCLFCVCLKKIFFLRIYREVFHMFFNNDNIKFNMISLVFTSQSDTSEWEFVSLWIYDVLHCKDCTILTAFWYLTRLFLLSTLRVPQSLSPVDNTKWVLFSWAAQLEKRSVKWYFFTPNVFWKRSCIHALNFTHLFHGEVFWLEMFNCEHLSFCFTIEAPRLFTMLSYKS